MPSLKNLSLLSIGVVLMGWLLIPVDYTYLGSGGQFIAYLSTDGKTVLKRFRTLPPDQSTLPLASAQIAAQELPEETGLLSLHSPSATSPIFYWIRTRLGFPVRMNLGATLFVLQKKAIPLKTALPSLDPKQATRDVEALLTRCFAKGIRDRDPAIKRNLGYLEGKPIFIDIGSFSYDVSLKNAEMAEKELEKQSAPLHRWLRKHSLLGEHRKEGDCSLSDHLDSNGS